MFHLPRRSVRRTVPAHDDYLTRDHQPGRRDPELAAKVRGTVESFAAVAADSAEEPAPLTDDESALVNLKVDKPDGSSGRKAAVVSTTTGEILAEQG
jgi:hypothetical protein